MRKRYSPGHEWEDFIDDDADAIRCWKERQPGESFQIQQDRMGHVSAADPSGPALIIDLFWHRKAKDWAAADRVKKLLVEDFILKIHADGSIDYQPNYKPKPRLPKQGEQRADQQSDDRGPDRAHDPA